MSGLIVALDFAKEQEALDLVEQLNPADCFLKVGSEMFTSFGPDFVKALVKKNHKVFLDLKFHDIPNTVAQACKKAAELGVWMINVHAAGGLKMMSAAKEALESFSVKPLLIAVTVLTSMESDELPDIGVVDSLSKHVLRLAKIAKQAQLDGVVCSAFEVPDIKTHCGADFLTITPGIRISDVVDDQKRVMTPPKAASMGSDYLVIGRPITRAADPSSEIGKILQMLNP